MGRDQLPKVHKPITAMSNYDTDNQIGNDSEKTGKSTTCTAAAESTSNVQLGLTPKEAAEVHNLVHGYLCEECMQFQRWETAIEADESFWFDRCGVCEFIGINELPLKESWLDLDRHQVEELVKP